MSAAELARDAIEKNDKAALMSLLENNKSILNDYLPITQTGYEYTLLGFAVRKGRKELVEAICGIPGVDFTVAVCSY